MVYRDEGTRHPSRSRLGQAGTDAVVEAHPIRCSHFDAFRFFTPPAVDRPAAADPGDPARAGAAGLPARGMDLYKWAYKLSPATPGELVADCFELAVEIRELDMRASPADLRSTATSRSRSRPPREAAYVAAQRGVRPPRG